MSGLENRESNELILGIETSCDETAAAVVEAGRQIRSNVIATQVDIHALYGGIVPEIASRQHILNMGFVINEALSSAGITLRDLSGIAVTQGPGLAGSLLVGLNLAKGLAFGLGLPLFGVNHLEGHIYANWLEERDPERDPGFPLMCLVVSGGHTDLIMMKTHGDYALLGRTRDDAAGEAFDKAARILGLGFPGGPAVQRIAHGVMVTEQLPRARLKESQSLDFSFSGVKTAVLHRAQARGIYPSQTQAENSNDVAEIAAAFQESVVDSLVTRTIEAAVREGVRGIILGGGVAANTLLREEMERLAPVPVLVSRPSLCTDNGAMVAACGFFQSRRDDPHGWNVDVLPSLRLG
jgi:N6-L-threonylcarbamoyladenine synthase